MLSVIFQHGCTIVLSGLCWLTKQLQTFWSVLLHESIGLLLFPLTIFTASSSPPRLGYAKSLVSPGSKNDGGETPLLSVLTLNVGHKVNTKAMLVCALPIMNLSGASYSGPFMKMIFSDAQGSTYSHEVLFH